MTYVLQAASETAGVADTSLATEIIILDDDLLSQVVGGLGPNGSWSTDFGPNDSWSD